MKKNILIRTNFLVCLIIIIRPFNDRVFKLSDELHSLAGQYRTKFPA